MVTGGPGDEGGVGPGWRYAARDLRLTDPTTAGDVGAGVVTAALAVGLVGIADNGRLGTVTHVSPPAHQGLVTDTILSRLPGTPASAGVPGKEPHMKRHDLTPRYR